MVVEEDNRHSRALDRDSRGYHTADGLREHSSVRNEDLDAAGVEIGSTEVWECIQKGECSKRAELFVVDIVEGKLPEEEDKRSEDSGIANGPSTRKRARPALTGAKTLAEVVGLGSEPELDDSGRAKRRRESLVSCLPSPPESALLAPRNEPGTGLSESDICGDAAGAPELHVTDFLEENNGSDSGAHHSEVVKSLLQLPSQPGSPLATVDEPHIEPDPARRRDMNKSNEGVDALGEASVDRVELVSRRTSTVPSRQRKLSKHPLLKREHNPSQNTSRTLRRRKTPMNTLRRVSPSGSYQLPGKGALRVTQPGCQQASVRTRAKDEPNTHINMSYQIVDFTLHAIPEGSSIITARIHCSESKPMPNLAALSLGILGDRGQAIRTIQISQDSWLLLGYRYNDDTPGLATRESLAGCEEGQKSYPRVDSVNDDADHVVDSVSGSEEDEDEEGVVQFCKRTKVPWSELDDLQLEAYVGMDMGWKAIFKRFPARTSGAVRTHWHTLQQKRQSTKIA